MGALNNDTSSQMNYNNFRYTLDSSTVRVWSAWNTIQQKTRSRVY